MSETPRPEDRQDRSQPRQRPSFMIGLISRRQPASHAGKRLAGEGKGYFRKIQAARPAAEGRGIGHTIRVFEIRQCVLPGAALHEAPPQRLTACQQTVMRVRERKQREEGEGLPATRAATAANLNPVMMLVVCLFAAAAVADDRLLFTRGTLRQDGLVGISRPFGFELVRRDGKWDKENRYS